jgi:hypothetical protein
MISDEDLVTLSYEVDDVLTELGNKYGINVLSMTSIVLARLALMNMYVGNREDFNRLIHEAVLPVTEKEISLH